MAKTKTLKFLRDSLYRLYEKGRGQPKAKGVHNETPYIHSHNTYITYKQQCNRFGKWAHARGLTDPKRAKEAIPEYIEELKAEHKSAWTIYTALCAVCKAYEISTEEIPVEIPKRRRGAIRRSREAVENDRHISAEKNRDLITFCQCFGLRHNRELAVLKAAQFERQGSSLRVTVKGKGGKIRTVTFCGTAAEQRTCERLIAQAGDGLIFPKIPSNFDAHYYRSVFACKVYRKYARPLNEIPDKDRYICRKDKRGLIYDRKALVIASRQLGHNRADVIVNNYLYNL